MQLHELKPKTRKVTATRIGRGGKRGKTSGRGHKGQLSRAGNSTRPEIRDFIKKLPKLRGHGVNRARTVNADKQSMTAVNVAVLQTAFATGETVSPRALVHKGVIRNRGKRIPAVKILGAGTLDNIALKVTGCVLSASARAKIEAAGGSVLD